MSGHKMPDRRDDDDGGGQGQQQDSVAEAMAAAHIANALGGSNNNTTSTNTTTNSNTAANVPNSNSNGSMFQSNSSPSSSSSNNNNILPRVPKCIFAPVSTSSTSSISNPFFSVPKQPSRPNTSVVVRASPPIDAAICPLPKMVLSPQQTSQSAKFGTPPTFAPLAPCSVGAFDPRLAGELSKAQRPQQPQSPKGLPTSKQPTTKTPSKIRPFQTMSPKKATAIRSPAPLPPTTSQKKGDINCLGKTAMRTYSQRANDKQKQKIAPKILPSPSPAASKPTLTTTIERVLTDTESDDEDDGGDHSSSATQQCFEINGNLFAHIHPPPLLTPHHLTVLNGSLAKAREEHPIQERAPEQLPWQNFTLKNHRHHQGLLTTRDQFTLEPLTLGPEVFEVTSEAGGEHGTRNSASVIKVSVTETIRFHVERKVKLIFESSNNSDKKVVVTGENDGNSLMAQVTDDQCPVGVTVSAAVVPAQAENERENENENEPQIEVEEGGGKISDCGNNDEPMDTGTNQQNSIVNGELEVEPNVIVTGQNSEKTSTGNSVAFAENGEQGGEQGAMMADDADHDHFDEIGGSGDQSGVVSLEQLEQLPVSHIFAAGDETFAKVNDDNDIVPQDEAAASSSATENGAT
ncbi:hypothetical protein TYRP_009481, partial [Tyrophagus putrescentiae]